MTPRPCAALIAFALIATTFADDAPQTPAPEPEPEHAWLQQLVGEWDIENEIVPAPGQPAMKCQGHESVRAVGGFWIVSHLSSSAGGESMQAVLTLGYDPATKRYVGTWIDSSNSFLWKYDGALDAERKVLTLEAEGPNPMDHFKTARFRDITEFKSPDERVLRSQIQQANGEWVTFVTGVARRTQPPENPLFKPL